MARVHYPTNAGQAWARGEAIGGDARLASEVPILLKSSPQSTDWAQWLPKKWLDGPVLGSSCSRVLLGTTRMNRTMQDTSQRGLFIGSTSAGRETYKQARPRPSGHTAWGWPRVSAHQ
jgi:hypothetical protein